MSSEGEKGEGGGCESSQTDHIGGLGAIRKKIEHLPDVVRFVFLVSRPAFRLWSRFEIRVDFTIEGDFAEDFST